MDLPAYYSLRLKERFDVSEHVFLPLNCQIRTISSADEKLFEKPTNKGYHLPIRKRCCRFILSLKCAKDVLDMLARYCIPTNDLHNLNIFKDINKPGKVGHTLRCYTFNFFETDYTSEDVVVPMLKKEIPGALLDVYGDDLEESRKWLVSYVVCGRKQFNLVVGKLTWTAEEEDVLKIFDTAVRLTELNWIDFDMLSVIVKHHFDLSKINFTARCFMLPYNGTDFISHDSSLAEFMNYDDQLPHEIKNSIEVLIGQPWTEFTSFGKKWFEGVHNVYYTKSYELDKKLADLFPSQDIIKDLEDSIVSKLDNNSFTVSALYIHALFDYSAAAAIEFCKKLCHKRALSNLVHHLRTKLRPSVLTQCFSIECKTQLNAGFTLQKADGEGKGKYLCYVKADQLVRDHNSHYIRGWDKDVQPLSTYLWRFESKISDNGNEYEIYFHKPAITLWLQGDKYWEKDEDSNGNVYVNVNCWGVLKEYTWVLSRLQHGRFAIGLRHQNDIKWLDLIKLEGGEEYFGCITSGREPAWIVTPYCGKADDIVE